MKEQFDALPEELKQRLAKIKFLAMDFDGTLTNNLVYNDQNTVETVASSRGDSLGLEFVRKYIPDFKIVILSKETNPVVKARAGKLEIPCTHGIYENKEENLLAEIKNVGATPETTCFIGNDLNDIGCIQKAGVGVAVADSYAQVLKVADYVTKHPGGNGAVREICEFLLYARNVHPHP